MVLVAHVMSSRKDGDQQGGGLLANVFKDQSVVDLARNE